MVKTILKKFLKHFFEPFFKKKMQEQSEHTGVSTNQDRLWLIYSNSPYQEWEFNRFCQEYRKYCEEKPSQIDFDDSFYLAVHHDVRECIRDGIFQNGFEHYCIHGANENRLWSDTSITHRFHLTPSYPTDHFRPSYLRSTEIYSALPDLYSGEERVCLLMLDNLQEEYFYAGYTSFFADFNQAFSLFDKVIISIENRHYEPHLVKQLVPNAQLIGGNELDKLNQKPEIIVAFSNHVMNKALALFRLPSRTIYYCQEYEAGFFPLSTRYVNAEKAIYQARNIILSTKLLHGYLSQKGLISNANVFITSPVIQRVSVDSHKENKLFFYFRPEEFHQRNLPEIIWQAAMQFCDSHSHYEIYMVGSVKTSFSFERNKNKLYIINKLDSSQYTQLLASCDLVVSLIYAPHPGVIAFQAAASGIPTITNSYENRDEETLRQISGNIIPFDPVREELIDKIIYGLTLPKGRPSFHPEIYGRPADSADIEKFISEIIKLPCE